MHPNEWWVEDALAVDCSGAHQDLTECELILAEAIVSGRRIDQIASERGVAMGGAETRRLLAPTRRGAQIASAGA